MKNNKSKYTKIGEFGKVNLTTTTLLDTDKETEEQKKARGDYVAKGEIGSIKEQKQILRLDVDYYIIGYITSKNRIKIFKKLYELEIKDITGYEEQYLLK